MAGMHGGTEQRDHDTIRDVMIHWSTKFPLNLEMYYYLFTFSVPYSGILHVFPSVTVILILCS